MKLSLSRISILVLIVPLVLSVSPVDACTCFCIDDDQNLVFGRNYDWGLGVGLLMVNKSGLSKTALIAPVDVPARWVSRYGSITFNQYGRELPTGGMNEKGLVVEVMWLQGSEYPKRDDRPALRELTWVQYVLDTCETVDEVIVVDSKVRITRDSTPIHFLICDPAGETVAIEFLEGKMVVHKGEGLPFRALANRTYERSLGYLRNCKGFGGDKEMPAGSTSSLDRFARAVRGVHGFDEGTDGGAIAHSFRLLADVSQGSATQWSIVYDVKNRSIQFKTGKMPKIRCLDFADFDFFCDTPCRVLDVDIDTVGDVHDRFVDYTMELNKKLIYEAWRKTSFLANTPELILDTIAGHPDSFGRAKPEVSPAKADDSRQDQ